MSAFATARKNYSRTNWERAARVFNAYTWSHRLDDLYTARVVKGLEDRSYQLLIGKELTVSLPVVGSYNLTEAAHREFRETIFVDEEHGSFVVREGVTRHLAPDDQVAKSPAELFEYLERAAAKRKALIEQAREIAKSKSNTYVRSDGVITSYNSMQKQQAESILDEGYHPDAYEPGELNHVNYEDWFDDLLAVAVVSLASEAGTGLPALLDEAMEQQVYGFLDRFTFDKYQNYDWKDILLNESTLLLNHYDVLFIDDRDLDNWDESWELDPREKQLLAEWAFAGGSLYLASALSGETTHARDNLFPGQWLELKLKNVLINGDFSIPWTTQNDYLTFMEDTGEYYDANWQNAKDEEGETFQWSKGSSPVGTTAGNRLDGVGNFTFHNTQPNGYSYLTVDPADAGFYTENERKYYYEVRLAPKFNGSFYQGFGLSVRINNNPDRYARLLYFNGTLLAGVSTKNTLDWTDVTTAENWVTGVTNTTYEAIANDWHTFRINIDETDVENKRLQFVFDGSTIRSNEEDADAFDTLDEPRRPYIFVGNPDNHWSNDLFVDYFESGLWEEKSASGWDFYSDTPMATFHTNGETLAGEYAYSYEGDGLYPNALRLGVIDNYDESDQPLYDCPSPDKAVNISQTFTVPETFAKGYFYFDYKKLTGLDSDRLEMFLINTKGETVVKQDLIYAQAKIDTQWQTFNRIDLTLAFRKYAGKELTLVLQASGDPETYLETAEGHHLFTDFLLENVLLSFIGGASSIPTLIYYDNDLITSIETSEYTSGSSSANEPYHSTHPFRARFFADELQQQLSMDGIPNVQQIATDELLRFLQQETPAVLVAAHPFPEEIYDGTSFAPLMDWVKTAGGSYIDTQAEPLSYYFDNTGSAYELVRVDQADIAVLHFDLFKSVVDVNDEPALALWSENFDDGASPLVAEIAQIKLEEFIGGYLEVKAERSPMEDFEHHLGYEFGVVEIHGEDDGKDVWWNSQWRHRRKLTFHYAGDPIYNFPVEVKWKKFDVNWSLFNEDGSDIRFSTIDGDPIDFWIEYFNNTRMDEDTYRTRIWVQLPVIKNGYNHFYLYYDNPACTTSLSNGEEVFTFFEDFETDGYLDPDKWETTGLPGDITATVEDGMFKVTDAYKNYENGVEQGWINHTGTPYQDKGSQMALEPFMNGNYPESFVVDFKIFVSGGSFEEKGQIGIGLTNSTNHLQLFGGTAVYQHEPSNDPHNPSSFVDQSQFSDHTHVNWTQYRIIVYGNQTKMYWRYADSSEEEPDRSSWYNLFSQHHYDSETFSTGNPGNLVLAVGAAEQAAAGFCPYLGLMEVRVRPFLWLDKEHYDGSAEEPREIITHVGSSFSMTEYIDNQGPENIYHTLLFENGQGTGNHWVAVEGHTDLTMDSEGKFERRWARITNTETSYPGDEYFIETGLDLTNWDGSTDLTVAFEGSAPSTNYENLLELRLYDKESQGFVEYYPEDCKEHLDSTEHFLVQFTLRWEDLLPYAGTKDQLLIQLGAVHDDSLPNYSAGEYVLDLNWLDISEDIPIKNKYEPYYLHLDVFLDGPMRVSLSGQNRAEEEVELVAVIGEDFPSYASGNASGETKQLFFSLPFDSMATPSELVNGSWNSVLIDLNMLAGALGDENLLNYAHALKFNCTGETTLLDNVWLGKAGPTHQQASAWLVEELTPFSSDYPLSLSVLEEMKQTIPGFEYQVFGRNEGARELLFKEEFTEEPYPTNDYWTELPLDDWDFYGEEVTASNTIGVTAGTEALRWNVTTDNGLISLSTVSSAFLPEHYVSLTFDYETNITLSDSSWVTNEEPLVILRDIAGETKNFTIPNSPANSTRSVTYSLEDGTTSSNFHLENLTTVELYLPKDSSEEPFAFFLDHLRFITGLSKKSWTWDGLINLAGGYAHLNGTSSLVSLQNRDQFGLGTIEWSAFLSNPEGGTRMGLTSSGSGGAYFEYQAASLETFPTWLYNRSMTIGNLNSEPLTDYQVVLELTPDTFDYSHCQPDGSDVQFFDENGTTLDYWIEEWTTEGTSKVWVKIPHLPANENTTISFCYGADDEATTKSDGSATFVAFDTFDDYSVNEAPKSARGWEPYGSYAQPHAVTDPRGGDGLVLFADNPNGARTIFKNRLPSDALGSLAVHFELAVVSGNGYLLTGDDGHTVDYTRWYDSYLCYYDGSPYEYFDDASSNHLRVLEDNWHSLTYCVWDDNTNIIRDGTEYSPKDGSAHYQSFVDGIEVIRFYTYQSGDYHKFYIDNFYVRKYVNQEPTVTLGEERVQTTDDSPLPADWWDSAWDYRQEVIIENPNSEALTDYQVFLTLTPETFAYSHCQPDGADLRFVDETNYELDYWLEDWNPSGTSKVWIEVPYLSADGTTIVLYYGNAQASSQSNGLTTFLVFDGGTGEGALTYGSVYGDEITEDGTGTYANEEACRYYAWNNPQQDGHYRRAWSGRWYTVNQEASAIKILTRYYIETVEGSSWIYVEGRVGLALQWTDGYTYGNYYRQEGCDGDSPHYYDASGWDTFDSYDDSFLSEDTWHTSDFSPATWHTGTLDKVAPFAGGGACHYYHGKGELYVDFFAVRKSAAAEPTATLGPVETGGSSEGGSESSTDWWDTNWAYRQEVTLTNDQASTLTDFPVYLAVEYRSTMQADFDDLRFLSDKGAVLPYDLDTYNASMAHVWVQLPPLAAMDKTTIWLYYGNTYCPSGEAPASVWTGADYELVLHLQDSSLMDATGLGHDGTNHGATIGSDQGLIGSGGSFDGTSNYLDLNMYFDSSSTIPEMTTSCWFKTSFSGSSYSDNWAFLDFDRSEFFNLFIRGDNGEIGFSTDVNSAVDDLYTNTGGYNDGQWHFVTAVYDGTDKILYVDGVEVARATNAHGGAALGTGNEKRYGFIGDGSEASSKDGSRNELYYQGELDEVRFMPVAQSAAWVKNYYDFVTKQNTKVDFSSEENRYATGPIGDWFDYSWQYRSAFTIANSGTSDRYNHLFELTLTENNFNYQYCAWDGSDFRIADVDGTVYNHYLYNWKTAGSEKISTVYVQIPSFEVGETKELYLYYGNPLAPAVSNESLFAYVDHFTSSGSWSNTDDDWTHVDLTSEQLRIVTGNNSAENHLGAYSYRSQTIPEDFVYSFDYYVSWGSDPSSQLFVGVSDSADYTLENINNGLFLDYTLASGGHFFALKTIINGEQSTSSNYAVTEGEWYTVRLEKEGATVRLFIDDVLKTTMDVTDLGSLSYLYVGGTDQSSPPAAKAFATVDQLLLGKWGGACTDVSLREAFSLDIALDGLWAVVSDGESESRVELDLPAFNPTMTHVYKIDREEQVIRFYLDDQLVAEFYENLPLYDETDPQQRVSFVAMDGSLSLDWVKYDEPFETFENIPQANGQFGEYFHDVFASRSPFPEDELQYDEWFQLPEWDSPHISTSFVSETALTANEPSLQFEYDGGSPDSPTDEYLEYRLPENASLTDFHLTVELDHWSEPSAGYRHFFVQLYHCEDEDYTLLGSAALIDCWSNDYGKYRVQAGDQLEEGYDTAEVPQQGSAKMVLLRESGQLTAKIYEVDGSDETLIRAVTTEGSGLSLNCLRLRYSAMWPTSTGQYGPSHTKVWVKDLLLEGRLTSTQYHLQGDVYVDPVAMSFGSGWLGFVKNTPQKPLTVSHAKESSTAAEWISYLIKNYLANKIEPSFDFYWQDPEQSGKRLMFATDKQGLQSLNTLYSLASLNVPTDAVIPTHSSMQFAPNLALRPGLLFADDPGQYDTLDADGFIRDWRVNTFEDMGFGYYYPELQASGYSSEPMTPSGTLFHTSFNESYWDYDGALTWTWEDNGSTDWSTGSGFVYDNYTYDSVFRLQEESILKDPGFELPHTLWNETSFHYLFVEDSDPDTNSSAVDYRGALDSSGWPAPSVYLYNPNETATTIHLGARFSLADYDLSGITNFLLEFDYWASHSNYTTDFGPLTIDTRLFHCTSDNWDNPLDSNDLYNRFEYVTGSHKTFDLYSNDSFYKHFSYDGYSNYLEGFLPTELYLLDLSVTFPGTTGSVNKQNQTLYLDNLSLTPYNVTGAQGDGTGFGQTMNTAEIEWNDCYDNNTIGLISHYPYIKLGNVLTTDYIYDGADFEFVTTVYDPTNDYTINLHYCWSGDDVLLGNHSDGEYLINGQVIDYYHHCQDHVLYPQPQTFYVNVYESINDLLQQTLIPFNRERIVHRLGFEFRLDTNATNIQVGSLTIQGSTPWRTYSIAPEEDEFSAKEIFGGITGMSELTVIASCFLWSNERRIVNFRVDSANSDIALYLNDQYVVHYDQADPTHNHTRSPQETTILKPGVNKLSVRMTNNKTGGKFTFWLLKQTFEATRDNSEISSSVVPTDLRVSTTTTDFEGYPVVSSSLGFGSINCWSLDFDSVDEPYDADEEAVLQFLINILNFEHQQRKPLLKYSEKKLVQTIEWSLKYKHQDVAYDNYNGNDPFLNTDDQYIILSRMEEIARGVIQNYPKVLAAARVKNESSAPNVDYDQLLSALETMFTEAHFTGNEDGWFPHTYLDVEPGQYSGYSWRDIAYVDFNRTRTVFTYVVNDHGGGPGSYYISRHNGIVKGWNGQDENGYSYTRITLQHLFISLRDRDLWQSDPQMWERNGNGYSTDYRYGSYRIYNDSYVIVDAPIQSDTGEVFLQDSSTSGEAYTLLEVLNATVHCLNELSTFKSETSETPLLSQMTNFLADAKSLNAFGMDLTAGLQDYVSGIQLNLFQTGKAQCQEYLLEREEQYLTQLYGEHPILLYNYLLEQFGPELQESLDYSSGFDFGVYLNPEYLWNTTRNPTTLASIIAITYFVKYYPHSFYRYIPRSHGTVAGVKRITKDLNKALIEGLDKKLKEWGAERKANLFESLEQPIIDLMDKVDKRSDNFLSFYQLFQSFDYQGHLTASSYEWLSAITAINKNHKNLKPDVLYHDPYLTTKIQWTVNPRYYVEDGQDKKLKASILASHSEVEGVSAFEKQSILQLGITEVMTMENLYGQVIGDLFDETTYAFPTMALDLRINREQFKTTITKIFGKDYQDTLYYGCLEKQFLSEYTKGEDSHKLYLLKGTNRIGDEFSSDILFEVIDENGDDETFRIAGIVHQGNQEIINKNGKENVEGLLITKGNGPLTSQLVDEQKDTAHTWNTGEDLQNDGYGWIKLDGVDDFEADPANQKSVYLWTKNGLAFDLKKGQARSVRVHYKGMPTKLEYGYESTNTDSNKNADLDNPRTDFVDTMMKKIDGMDDPKEIINAIGGVFEISNDRSTKAADAVVINYRPSYDYIMEMYKEGLRIGIETYRRMDSNDKKVNIRTVESLITQFMVFMALPRAIEIMKTGTTTMSHHISGMRPTDIDTSQLTMSQAIEIAKMEIFSKIGGEEWGLWCEELQQFVPKPQRKKPTTKYFIENRKEFPIGMTEAIVDNFDELLERANTLDSSSDCRGWKDFLLRGVKKDDDGSYFDWSNKAEIAEILFKLQDLKHKVISQLVDFLNQEELAPEQESLCYPESLLFDVLTHLSGDALIKLKDKGIKTLVSSATIDAYHLKKALIHVMAGLTGINEQRDYRDVLLRDENGNPVLKTHQFLPLVGILKIFLYMDKHLGTYLEGTQAGSRGRTQWENFETIYDESGNPILPSAWATRFVTRVLNDNNKAVPTGVHIDLATQSGLRHMLDLMVHMTLMTENRDNPANSDWNELVETLGLYQWLHHSISSENSITAVKLTVNSDNFFNSLDPTKRGADIQTQEIFFPYLYQADLKRLTGQERIDTTNRDFASVFGAGLFAEPINVHGTAYTIGDFLRDSIVFVDEEGNLFKYVTYQEVDENGEAVKDQDGQWLWRTIKIELTEEDLKDIKNTAKEDMIDPSTEEKFADPYTALTVYEDPEKTKVNLEETAKNVRKQTCLNIVPWFESADGKEQLNIIVLKDQAVKEKQIHEQTNDPKDKTVEVAELADVDEEEIKRLLHEQDPEAFTEERLTDLKIKVMSKDSLELTKNKLAAIKRNRKKTAKEDYSFSPTAKDKLDDFFGRTLWFGTPYFAITESLPARLLGRFLPFSRASQPGNSLKAISDELLRGYWGDKVVDKVNAIGNDKVKKIAMRNLRIRVVSANFLSYFYQMVRALKRKQDATLGITVDIFQSHNKIETNNADRQTKAGTIEPNLETVLPINSMDLSLNPEVYQLPTELGIENHPSVLSFDGDKKKSTIKTLDNGEADARTLVKTAIVYSATTLGAMVVSGTVNNAIQQTWMYLVLGWFSQMAFTDLLMDNFETLVDKNRDGLYNETGERGIYYERYAMDYEDPVVNQAHNLTRHKHGLTKARYVWATDYMEAIGDDLWEFVNAVLAGRQMALINCGMTEVVFNDIESVADAWRGKRQLEGKWVPQDPQDWLRSPAFYAFWQGACLVAGAIITMIGEIVTKTFKGAFLGFCANGVSGAIIGAGAGFGVGVIKGLIGIGQSFAAGAGVNAAWGNVWTSAPMALWTRELFHPWTETMKGDADGLILRFKVANAFYTFGLALRFKKFQWLYINNYFDLGPWAGAFDSLLAPAILSFVTFIGISTYFSVFGASLAVSLLAGIVGIVVVLGIYAAVFGVLKILQLKGVLPEHETEHDPLLGD